MAQASQVEGGYRACWSANFLVLTVAVPLSAGAYVKASGLLQTIPTVDITATMTALNEEKLQHENDWWWSNGATILSSTISALFLVGGALIGFWQWRMNREDVRTKESNERKEAQDKELRDRAEQRQKDVAAQNKELRAEAEERFGTAVTALGDENQATQVGGAVLLRSFLNKEDGKIYGRYYTQIFDLVVAYLRFPRSSNSHGDTYAATAATPLTPLSRALIIVFKEAFILARDRLKEQDPKAEFQPQSLDATGIQLDNAYLAEADLKEVWMPNASLRGANLERADLTKAHLTNADFREAQFRFTDFTDANLESANLSGIFPS